MFSLTESASVLTGQSDWILPRRPRILQSPLHQGLVELDCFSALHLNGGRVEGEGVGVRGSTGERDEAGGRTLLQLRWTGETSSGLESETPLPVPFSSPS